MMETVDHRSVGIPPKVILIGGSPMTGKSTLAAALSAKLGWQYVSTDDIGEIIQTALGIDPMRGVNYLDYYANTDKSALVEDILAYHLRIQPAVSRLTEINSAWGGPLIIEGWALYPEYVKNIGQKKARALWLVAEGDLLERRLRDNPGFYESAGEPEKVIENYLYRSEWHNGLILKQCEETKAQFIKVNGSEAEEKLLEIVWGKLNI
ncbi:MAG: hypothetical protein FWF44_09690 [Defluviitaleaceae bacterium]|nr:hypothetical protein [Defluviitaleaceae bacterium]